MKPEMCFINSALTFEAMLVLVAFYLSCFVVFSLQSNPSLSLDQYPKLDYLMPLYLSLATMSDKVTGIGNVNVMYDFRNGLLVEEWTVPLRAGDPWVTSRNITIDLAL